MATDIQLNNKFKEFGSLKQQLSVQISKNDSSKNLFIHMSKVMDHIVMHCPHDALNKL